MNKKAMIATALSSMIVLGGATIYQQAYATTSPISAEKSQSPIPVKVSTEAELQVTPIYGSISLPEFEANNEIKIPLSLEKEQQDSTLSTNSIPSSSSTSNKIINKLFVSLEDSTGTDTIQIVYVTEDQSEVNIFQMKSIDRNPQAVIAAQKVYFDPSLIQTGSIQGHPAIFEDTSFLEGGSKKQVLIATEDYYYTIQTGSPTVDLNNLKEIAQKINF